METTPRQPIAIAHEDGLDALGTEAVAIRTRLEDDQDLGRGTGRRWCT